MADEETTALVSTAGAVEVSETEAVFQEGFLALTAIEDGQQVSMAALDELSGRISTVSRNSPWWLGDLLTYAAEHYGDDWHQLVDNVGHTLSEILDRVDVAGTFPPKDRLIAKGESPGLSWEQHKLFAKVYADKGTRTKAKKLMKKAADSGWGFDEIRDAVRNLTAVEVSATEAEDPNESKSTVFTVAIRVPASEGPAAMAMLDGLEKAAADPLIQAGIHVTDVRSRVSGVVPPSEPKKRGRPRKNQAPVEAEADTEE